MKIRAKITILFCATVILIMAVMGVISNRMNAVTTMDLVEKNLTVMADRRRARDTGKSGCKREWLCVFGGRGRTGRGKYGYGG